MAWEQRGSRRIYYRSERDGRRVRRVYLGSGPVAELAATLDELRRAERRAEAQARRAEEARRSAAAALLERLVHAAGLMAEAALERAGYHRHDRGKWRRRRMAADDVNGVSGTVAEGDPRELLGRAERGDRSTLPELRRLLDDNPQVWRRLGDLAAHAEAAWADLACGDNLVLREALARKLAELKADLGGSAPTPLVRLLAERVAACWLHLHHADAVAARARGGELSLAQLDATLKRQERAQRAYLAALKALAVVRRLLPAPEHGRAEGGEQAAAGRVAAASSRRPAGPARAAAPADGRGHRTRSATRQGRPAAAMPKAVRQRLRGLVGSDN
jgi:hypothetical protein